MIDIQKLAAGAGFAPGWERDDPRLVMFAALVIEECAEIAETAPDGLQDSTFDGVARAIRKLAEA